MFDTCTECNYAPKTADDILDMWYCPKCLGCMCNKCACEEDGEQRSLNDSEIYCCDEYFARDETRYTNIPVLKEAAYSMSESCPDCSKRFFDNDAYANHRLICDKRKSMCLICDTEVTGILEHIGGTHTTDAKLINKVLNGENMDKITSKAGGLGIAETFADAIHHPTFEEQRQFKDPFTEYEEILRKRYKIHEGCVVNACPEHPNPTDRDEIYACNECGKTVCKPCQKELRRNDCPACRANKSIALIPIFITEALSERISAKCPWCRKFFLTESMYEEHVESCVDARIQCGICNETVHPHHLKAHVGEYHVSLEYVQMFE